MHTTKVGIDVLYLSQTDDYIEAPAVINATQASVRAGGDVPPLSGPDNVHLTVFTPEKPSIGTSTRAANVTGVYQEWDVPLDETGTIKGTWRHRDREHER